VEFSYIKVFDTSVPPYALLLFLPNKLLCREIARQTILDRIRKELKGVSKKVWPPFPIHIGAYSLLDFGHAKAEATTLKEMKLVDIEFKKHDPSKVVSNHLTSCGLKRYEHEDSPHDEIFQGVRSFSEVLSRIQALLPGDMADFLKFQEHRWSCLPHILQGEAPKLPVTKQTEAKGAKDSNPNMHKNQGKTMEVGTSEQGAEVPYKHEGNPEKGMPGKQVQGQAGIPSQGSGDSLSLISKNSVIDVTPKQSSKEVDSLIAIITPLKFTKGNLDAGWIFYEELTPISIEELPPNEIFFDKKRKAMVRQELYQREGIVAKKFKIMTYGKAVKEEEFTDKIAGTLGAYATTNQYSVGTLKAQLKRKNLLISKLEAKVATAEANAKDEVRKSLEQT
jgi:hypothetical protein